MLPEKQIVHTEITRELHKKDSNYPLLRAVLGGRLRLYPNPTAERFAKSSPSFVGDDTSSLNTHRPEHIV